MPSDIVALQVSASMRHAWRRASLRAAAFAGVAVAVISATFMALPRPIFSAAAVVGADGGPVALRPAMIQAALDAAASRSVLERAAAGLAGSLQTGSGRLADRLSAAVRAETGHVPGTLVLRAGDTDAETAAAMASAVAAALVAEFEEREQAARRDDEKAAAGRLAVLRQNAAAAHARLTTLDGDVPDLVASRAVAAARADALRDKLDAVQAILASGEPPLGTGRDVPPAIEALQSSYLDLTRQLAKARQTLGDRHTTVVGLRDGVERTATELSAAWRRLAKTIEAELAAAKAQAKPAVRVGDAGRARMIEAARLEAQAADDALGRAEATTDREDAMRFRLIAAAPVPAAAEGLSAKTRSCVAVSVGLATLVAILFVRRRRVSPEPRKAVATRLVAEPREPRLFEEEIVPTAEEAWDIEAEPMLLEVDTAIGESDEEHLLADAQGEAPLRARADLKIALAGALPAIAAITARAEIPVVMVATDEIGVGMMEAVLALGEAAAADGQRVLIVEGDKARPALAAAVDVEAEPALLDVFGSQRIALKAEAGDGLVYLAPSFRDGAQLAADLAQTGEVLVADGLAEEFDLVVIDGDGAADMPLLAGEIDGILRVGRFASTRDDERFLVALGMPQEALLGTIVTTAAIFVPRPAQEPVSAPVKPDVSVPQPLPLRMPQPIARRHLQADVRRRVAAC